MSKVCPHRIIREARFCKKSATLSVAEIEYLSASELKDSERFLWIYLAQLTANDPHFSCAIPFLDLSRALNKSIDEIQRALNTLSAMGFITLAGHIITLTFPLAGLLWIKKAERGHSQERMLHRNCFYKRPAVLINLLNKRINYVTTPKL